MRVLLGRELVLRRARGYAPLPVRLNGLLPGILAVGAHFKNAVALSVGRDVFISQHIGDLETKQANAAFRKVCADLQGLYEATPELTLATCTPITSPPSSPRSPSCTAARVRRLKFQTLNPRPRTFN